MTTAVKKRSLERGVWDLPIGAALWAWITFAVQEDTTRGWTIYALGWIGPLLMLIRSAISRKAPWGGGVVPVTIGVVAGVLFWVFYG
ncbi:hypothetical protein ACFWXK_11740 [Streptomyces sp. NPDC059070]|uniref:hypothetical protein n=1 Tax=unclassified Streptomyces TaxID=2593676 RepID=UPI0034E1DB26